MQPDETHYLAYCHREGFIFSRALDEIRLITVSLLLPHTLCNERIFPQSVKEDPSCTFRSFIKPLNWFCLCLFSFWHVKSHSIVLVNVQLKWMFSWFSHQWFGFSPGLLSVTSSALVSFHQVWLSCMSCGDTKGKQGIGTRMTAIALAQRDSILIQKVWQDSSRGKNLLLNCSVSQWSNTWVGDCGAQLTFIYLSLRGEEKNSIKEINQALEMRRPWLQTW